MSSYSFLLLSMGDAVPLDLSQYCSVYKNKFNKINLLNIKNTPSNALSEQYWVKS